MNFFNHGWARMNLTDEESQRPVAPIVNRLYRRLATGRADQSPGASKSLKDLRFHYFKLNRAGTHFAFRMVSGLTIRDTADCQSALRPSGTTENSPAFQRWDGRAECGRVPTGTAESGGKTNRFFRPFGTVEVAPIVNRLYRRLATGKPREFPSASKSRKDLRFHYFKLNRAGSNFAVRTVCGLTIRDTADCQSALRGGGVV
jgi:hypothetical protein